MSSPASPNVRNMISIFENQTINVGNESTQLQLKRAKSMGSLSNVQVSTQPKQVFVTTVHRYQSSKEKSLELTQIDQQLQHLRKTLSNYKTYSRESHIYYQNQIFFLLTDIINVDTRNAANIIHERSELVEVIKRLNKHLNSLLPASSTQAPVQVVKEDDETDSKIAIVREEKVVVREIRLAAAVKVPSQKKEEIIGQISVKNLKQFFEKNSAVQNGEVRRKVDPKVSRYNTFNSKADLKYTPYAQKLKSTFNGELETEKASTLQWPNTIEVGSVRENGEQFNSSSVPLDEALHEDTSDKEPANFHQDSLSSDSGSSDEDSEGEKSAKEEERS